MAGALDPLFVWSNYAEAFLWVAIGVAVSVFGRSRARIGLTTALIAFGVSDLVETRTGAWYRPWWLLGWKAACVLAMVVLGAIEIRSRRRN